MERDRSRPRAADIPELGAGPNYDLVRRFFSRPADGEPFWERGDGYAICDYCGDIVPRGIPAIVCCHERAVRIGNMLQAASSEQRPTSAGIGEAVVTVLMAAVTLAIILYREFAS